MRVLEVLPAKAGISRKAGIVVSNYLRACLFPRACFREYFVHKFRAMLGKNRAIYPGEKVESLFV